MAIVMAPVVNTSSMGSTGAQDLNSLFPNHLGVA